MRNVTRVDVSRHGEFVVLDVSANAFLHHMVRNIVGSLVYVGAGRQPAAWLSALLLGRNRQQAAPTFDAAGLYLSGVDYDPR